MSELNKYFNDPNMDSFGRVRTFIDKILGLHMGLNDNIRLNPALEKDLYYSLSEINMSQMNLDARPLIIAGKKYEIIDGSLQIEEEQSENKRKTFKKTTYQPSNGGIIKSTDLVSGYDLGENGSADESYSQSHSFFTNQGVEMSRVDLSENIGEIKGSVFATYVPRLEPRHIATAYRFDSQNNLEIARLPENYTAYTRVYRDSTLVEQAAYFERRKDENGEVEYEGKINICSEHGIDRFSFLGHICNFCQKKDLKTGEITPADNPQWLKEYSEQQLEGGIKASALGLQFSTGLRAISPLQRRLIDELISMSRGRCRMSQYFTTADYAATTGGLDVESLGEVLTVLSKLTPDLGREAENEEIII